MEKVYSDPTSSVRAHTFRDPFIWLPRGQTLLAIECKWSARVFDPASLPVFARAYPKPDLLVVTADARPAFIRHYDGRRVHFLTLEHLVERITA